jgi:thiol-disulfide isomerase/thioredoxin
MDGDTRGRARRAFLGSGLAAAGALAGCLGGITGSEAKKGDGLALDTVAVAGSPGGTMAVKPAGEPALLDFFATWCAPCKPQMAELRAVREEFPDLHMLSITFEEDPGLVESFWTEYEGRWPVATDPAVRTGERYGVQRIPTLLVLAPDGTEGWRHVGLASAAGIGEQVEQARER